MRQKSHTRRKSATASASRHPPAAPTASAMPGRPPCGYRSPSRSRMSNGRSGAPARTGSGRGAGAGATGSGSAVTTGAGTGTEPQPMRPSTARMRGPASRAWANQ
ncbi:hypothetical protein BF95_26060 [Sphingobium sp. Ant17]|nr:hypothetical protein BF95_26060 [Sphingobium sp. Ant17]